MGKIIYCSCYPIWLLCKTSITNAAAPNKMPKMYTIDITYKPLIKMIFTLNNWREKYSQNKRVCGLQRSHYKLQVTLHVNSKFPHEYDSLNVFLHSEMLLTTRGTAFVITWSCNFLLFFLHQFLQAKNDSWLTNLVYFKDCKINNAIYMLVYISCVVKC